MVTGGEPTAPHTGVCTLHDMLWRWTVATEMPDGLAVVEWMPHPARPDYDRPFYGLAAFVDGHPTDALCQCEHSRAAHAEHCAKASAELARRRAVVFAARCAAMPAPVAHGYLTHCGASWPASRGGACGVCGAAGDVWRPRVTLTVDKVHTMRVDADLPVEIVARDLGDLVEYVRGFGGGFGVVGTRENGMHRNAADLLTARGWDVDGTATRAKRGPLAPLTLSAQPMLRLVRS